VRSSWQRAACCIGSQVADDRLDVSEEACQGSGQAVESLTSEEHAMSPQQPTYEFHPEFGYLCPSVQLRQNVRVGLAAAAFGLIAGVGGAMALLPRHSDDVVRTEPVSAVAPLDSVSHLTTAKQVSADGVVKPLPAAAPISSESANEAPPAVEMPAQAAPLVTTDRMAALKEGEPARAVSSKRVKPASSSARRRVREPAPLDSFATRPLGFHLSPFAYDTRSARRRDWGGNWSW
jgi:hypothetical protein